MIIRVKHNINQNTILLSIRNDKTVFEISEVVKRDPGLKTQEAFDVIISNDTRGLVP